MSKGGLEKAMMEKVKNNMVTFLVAAALIAGITLTGLVPAQAKPFRMGLLPDKGAKFGCGTCHVNPSGGGARNPFGQDFEKVGIKAGEKYTPDLGALDSDKDGAGNDVEFKAGTHPGDPASKPAS